MKTHYQIKIGNIILKETTNQKDAQTFFHKERARHGGKVKFFEIRRR